MKYLVSLVVLPIALVALEKVNLIKNGGFEKDNNEWIIHLDPDGEYDSTVIESKDSTACYFGNYSASVDTRTQPATVLPNLYTTRGYLYQIPLFSKKLEDLDSIEIFHMALFREEDNNLSTSDYGLGLGFTDPSNEDFINVWYIWLALDIDPASDSPTRKIFADTIDNEGEWRTLSRNLDSDLVGIKSLSTQIELDSFILYGYGLYLAPWRGQKVFFDGIRLTGYADYDVGVKGILSGDSLDEDTPYTPIARIKNFGRENAPEFSVIAEIFEGTTRVYYDSLPWSLTSDTEDTVTFAAFTPSGAGNHTLAVRTSMSPDESDEDDEMTKTLYGLGIEEQFTPQALNLDVLSLQVGEGVLRVSYSLPQNEQGTITLYDPTGRRVESLKVQGEGSVSLKPELSSGVYFIKLETGKTSVTKKAVVLK